MKEENEGYTKWNKGKYTGNQHWKKETETQISDLELKEERNIQWELDEEIRIQKIRRGLGTFGTTLNIPTSKS